MAGDERRRGERIDCQFPAQIVILFPDRPLEPFSALVLVSDISTEGVKVLCPQPGPDALTTTFRTGQAARLFLHNGDERARVPVRIVWATPNSNLYSSACLELGLSYDLSEPSNRISVEQFIKRGRATQLRDQMSITPTSGMGL